MIILDTRGWGFTNTTTCSIQDHQCEEPPEVTCSFTGCSSVPVRGTKFVDVRNIQEEMIAQNSNHTLVCGDKHSVGDANIGGDTDKEGDTDKGGDTNKGGDTEIRGDTDKGGDTDIGGESDIGGDTD